MTNISLSLEKRQTMLFSATQTRKVEDLARISLKKEPLYVGVDDNKDTATVEGLEQVNALYQHPWVMCCWCKIFEFHLNYLIISMWFVLF